MQTLPTLCITGKLDYPNPSTGFLSVSWGRRVLRTGELIYNWFCLWISAFRIHFHSNYFFIKNKSTELVKYFCIDRTFYPFCKRQRCKHNTRKTQVTERIFKLTLIHASVIYQICRIYRMPLHFVKTPLKSIHSIWSQKVSNHDNK